MQASRTLLWQSRRRLSQAVAARASSSPANAFASTSGSSSSAASDAGQSFYLATLPWRNTEKAAETQAFRVEENDGIGKFPVYTA